MGKLFGTDGIRGVANVDLTCGLALKTATASAQVLSAHTKKKIKVIIGQDTRASGDMLANAMAAGFASAGADAYLLGEIPTPAVAYLVGKYKADIGVVISASHNPAKYNGIKIFNKDGYKLPDSIEEEIENAIFTPTLVLNEIPGKIHTIKTAVDDYVDFLISAHSNTDLTGIRVVVDCANGASSITAEKLFKKLKVDAIILNNSPDGLNINMGCGSTHIEIIQEAVKSYNANIGIAFDGDADRCLAVDENGVVLDGDRITAAIAIDLKQQNKLKNNKVAVTTMSNLAFTKKMNDNGIEVISTKVGDRYVLEHMLKEDLSIGGEQSGHVILLDTISTGDGELTALKLLEIVKKNGNKSSYITSLVIPYPQILNNIHAEQNEKEFIMEDIEFNREISKAENLLGDSGRVLIRASGTEPLIRIMVEGQDIQLVENLASKISEKAKTRILNM
ncbi:MAG: phosphoglucosamine mutase [Clostridia bacterium]